MRPRDARGGRQRGRGGGQMQKISAGGRRGHAADAPEGSPAVPELTGSLGRGIRAKNLAKIFRSLSAFRAAASFWRSSPSRIGASARKFSVEIRATRDSGEPFGARQDHSRVHRPCEGQSRQDQYGVGRGSTPHVAGELFKMMAGIDMVHVPYRGARQGGPGGRGDVRAD
jgi:hypothetical protein